MRAAWDGVEVKAVDRDRLSDKAFRTRTVGANLLRMEQPMAARARNNARADRSTGTLDKYYRPKKPRQPAAGLLASMP